MQAETSIKTKKDFQVAISNAVKHLQSNPNKSFDLRALMKASGFALWSRKSRLAFDRRLKYLARNGEIKADKAGFKFYWNGDFVENLMEVEKHLPQSVERDLTWRERRELLAPDRSVSSNGRITQPVADRYYLRLRSIALSIGE